MGVILTGIPTFDERLMAAMSNAERIDILNECAAFCKESPGNELKLEKVNRYIASISGSQFISLASMAALEASVKTCLQCDNHVAASQELCRTCTERAAENQPGIKYWIRLLLGKNKS